MFTKKRFFVLSSLAMLLAIATYSSVMAATKHVWTKIDDTELSRRPLSRTRTPDNYKTFQLNKQNLDSILDAAPEEFSQSATETILELPMPDGTFGKFRVSHSLIVEQGLLVNFPELGRTFSAQGIDDPTATARLDYLPSGFHAMILSPNGTVMIDPYAVGDVDNYVTYYKRDLPKLDSFNCEVGQRGFESIYNLDPMNAGGIPDQSADVTSGGTLRTYRLALAATVEYSTAVGSNTIAGALAAEVLIMNRVNGVYERDLSMRMVIIANNNLITYAGNQTCAGVACTTANDPYTNNSGSTMLGENQTNIDAVIGTASYDIGHVFSTGGGGVANLAVPCGSSKARGVTGLGNPIGDAFAIDYVAHEIGHQWGSNHTFNGASGSCSGGNRSGANAYEPGSGITVMAYAGICGTQNLAANSIDTMHVRSLEVIVAYSQTGNGNTCDVETASGNTPPTVPIVGGPYNIPKQTPFSLTASSTDVNGDSITYDWQEYDLGASTTAVPNTDAGGAMPIFRNYVATVSGTRTFPSLPFILNNANVPPATTGSFLTGELLPQIGRTMNFQVVARDNRSGGGGINTATAVVNVDGASGPFVVTSPNTNVNWSANSSQTVAWNVANTTAAPVSAANVRILFSSDGGLTFPTTIIASTPNDGTETITVPDLNTTLGRIKIEGIGNIFFDISDTNFTIGGGGGTISVTVQTNPAGRAFTVDGTPYFTSQVFNWIPSSVHTIATTTPQAGAPGTSYTFSNWSDAGAISHTVSPAATSTYTANFATVSCTYSLSPTSQNFSAGGGTGQLQVITQAGCPWTAVSNSLINSTNVVSQPTAVFPGKGVGAIPDAAATGPQAPGTPLDISFNVSGMSGAPNNVEINMTGSHSWAGDLKATLIAPNATSFTVFGYTGATSTTSFGSSSDLAGLYNFKDSAAGTNWWTAAAATPIPAGDYRTTISGPTTSPAAVTNLTSAFSGVTSPNGTWILRLTDGATGDTGSISAANLTLTNAVPNWITVTGGQSGTGNGTVNYTVAANGNANSRLGTMTIAGQTFTACQNGSTQTCAASTIRAPFDYDGDNKTDVSIYRPGPGQWWYLKSSDGSNSAITFGASTDKIVPADYTGDQKSDFAVWRPSTGQWLILRSEDFSFFAFPLGVSTDVPVPGDFDGDGKADASVYRPSTNTWYINKTSGGTDILTFGASGDIPVVGNYDGDTKADLAIFRPSVGQWWIRRSSDTVTNVFSFGISTDKLVPGDYTGDGKTDVAFWRPSTGAWFILRSEDSSFFSFPFGVSTDTPVPGDYDGDGKFDAGIFRSSTNTWYLQRSTAGTQITGFGVSGDIPTPSAYIP